MKNNTIDSKLLSAQVAIENSLTNSTIKESLAPFKYDEVRLQAGKALYDAARAAQDKQKKEYGEQFEATDELDAAMSAANMIYMTHVKIARVALKSQRGASEALQLSGRRKQTYSGWIKQTNVFYTNALDTDNIKSALDAFGITTKKLKEGQAAVKEVESKLTAQLKEKGEAQAATLARDEALDELQEWMSDFVTIARIALENEAQYLEILGIIEPS